MDEDICLNNEDDPLRLKTYLQKEQFSILSYEIWLQTIKKVGFTIENPIISLQYIVFSIELTFWRIIYIPVLICHIY